MTGIAKAYFMSMIGDGLSLPSGAVFPSPEKLLVYFSAPWDWVDGAAPEGDAPFLRGPGLKLVPLERLFEALYGANWRAPNEDGSRYVVLDMVLHIQNPKRSWSPPNFTPEDLKARTPPLQLHFYEGLPDGSFRRSMDGSI